MTEQDDESFVRRWSRRKQAARRGEAEPAPTEAEHDEPPEASGDQPAPDGEVAAPPGGPPALPDPETLDAASDFRVFLQEGVPLEKHQAALRRLWRLDPIYNRLDGLDDYCEDYTDKARAVKGLRTAYRVGKGMLEHIEALERGAVPRGEEEPAAGAPPEPTAATGLPATAAVAPEPASGQAEPGGRDHARGRRAAEPAASEPRDPDAHSSVRRRRPRPLPRRG